MKEGFTPYEIIPSTYKLQSSSQYVENKASEMRKHKP